jgi:hypothetical protein
VFFPGVGQRPGFDLALGNPPWERIKLQEQEFFASRDPEIASASNKAARQKLIDGLANASHGSADHALHDFFIVAKRNAEAASVFARTPGDFGGRYPLTGVGDVNTYALFSELFSSIAKRAAIIVPTELATSDTTKAFFAKLTDNGRLRSLYDFQTGGGFFDRIGHARFKFALVAIAEERQLSDPSFRVAFFLRTHQDITDHTRYFYMSKSDIAAINPNTRTAPVFRSQADAELTKEIYARVPVLIDESKSKEGNRWGVEFHTRIWHMSEDAKWFLTSTQLTRLNHERSGRYWISASGERLAPLYEAKMIHHYDHRWATYETNGKDSRQLTAIEKANPDFEAMPRYWVPADEVESRLASKNWQRGWLMGWRDITNATNERTVIAGVIPKSASGDKFLLMFPQVAPKQSAALLATMTSLTFDFIARQKLGGTSLKLYVMQQLPVLSPSAFTAAELGFIVPRVLELTYTSRSMKPFADDLGFKSNTPFLWNEDRREVLRAELDAKIAKLYGLSRDQLRYILDPTDIYGPAYASETFRGLKKNEVGRFGEYRTARLVLDAWDRMERGDLTS